MNIVRFQKRLRISIINDNHIFLRGAGISSRKSYLSDNYCLMKKLKTIFGIMHDFGFEWRTAQPDGFSEIHGPGLASPNLWTPGSLEVLDNFETRLREDRILSFKKQKVLSLFFGAARLAPRVSENISFFSFLYNVLIFVPFSPSHFQCRKIFIPTSI